MRSRDHHRRGDDERGRLRRQLQAERHLLLRARVAVRRSGGPYRQRAEAFEDVALWLTLHEDMSEIEGEFRTLYSEGKGKALIERRPALVAETTVAYYDSHPFD